MKNFMVLFCIFAFIYAKAEDNLPTQIIKGKIININTQQPISGARVFLSDAKKGSITKSDGTFEIADVLPARYTFHVSSVGYNPYIEQIVLTTGKQLFINVELEETFYETDEVTVYGKSNNFTAINESAIVSTMQFSVDDAQRFAGSRMDPARMAQNFAGVVGANDSRNDIIIRGGSPTELLWRIDGLDVPNPNHFATQGATGGPVSALNTALLDNSDFLTGAFPSEYNDRMSGVFDLRTRQGNKDKYEFLGQFGFNGFELGAEGPLNKNSSFIANYRYSFLGLMEDMGIDFGFAGIPKYQDATLKYDWDINSNNRFSITSIYGTSDIHIQESQEEDAYTGDFDIKNGTDFLAVAMNWKSIYSDKLWGNLLLGYNFQSYSTTLDSVTTDELNNVLNLFEWYNDKSTEGFTNVKYTLNYSPAKHHYFKIGAEGRMRNYDLFAKRTTDTYHIDKAGSALQTLSFINWNWRLAPTFTSNIGVSSQYLRINNEITIEPRAAFAWHFLPKHNLSIGFGLYRQSLPLVMYFSDEQNEKLDFMQSIHYILGYSFLLNQKSVLKFETYYKDLSKIPIEDNLESTWSFQNSGTNFGGVDAEEAVSKGFGKTYGAELSYIRNFTEGYYITSTFSYVRQEYKAGDGKWRWGAFDNKFILNILAGYEWVINPKFSIEFSGRYTLAGGNPYTPIDLEKSAETNSTEYDNSKRFLLRQPDYNRLDFRVDFRQHFRGLSIVSYFSIENLINTQNIQSYLYDAQNNSIKKVYQIGFFPVGGIRVEF